MMMWQTNDQVPDFYRSALKSTLDMMNICLNGVERLQAYQTGAVKELHSGHEEITKRIASLDNLQDLQAAHGELMRGQVEKMLLYWNGLVAASCQYQAEILSDAQGKAREVTEQIAQKLEAAPVGAAAPVLTAIKLAVGATESTYAATIRAAEEMVRLSAAQIDVLNARNARQGNGKAKRAA